MNWLYDNLPEWLVYVVAAWFAALALLVFLLYLRRLHVQVFEDDDAYAESNLQAQMRARIYWQEERAGRIRQWHEPAPKGFQREHIHRQPDPTNGKEVA